MKEITVCRCSVETCWYGKGSKEEKDCQACQESDGNNFTLHRAVVLEEISKQEPPKKGDMVMYVPCNETRELVTINDDGSAWLRSKNLSKLNSAYRIFPGSWKPLPKPPEPKRGDLVIVRLVGGKQVPAFFHSFGKYRHGGVTVTGIYYISNEFGRSLRLYSEWRFPTKEDLEAIYGSNDDGA